MRNFLLAFFVFLLWSLFGMWYYSCHIKGLCNEEEKPIVTETVVEKEIPKVEVLDLKTTPFAFKDENNDIIFEFPHELQINSTTSEVKIAETSLTFKDSVFSYLNQNQNKELIITGLYNKSEKVIKPNLGIARAKKLKEVLVTFGINTDKITIDSKFLDYKYLTNGTFNGGALFNFKTISTERLKEIESGVANKTLYSGFGSKGFKPDNTLKTFALELKAYLNKYPNKIATITGHTDSVGDPVANDWFGMERAKNVKQYLEILGIDATKLVALSKGETEPIDVNTTLEGRRKNRRIEIKTN